MSPEEHLTIEEFQPDDQSAFDRFVEVFTSPTEAFAGLLRTKKTTSIILLGLAITIVINVVAVLLFSANPKAIESVKEERKEAIEKAHESGKMEDEMYEAQIEQIDQLDQSSMLLFGLPSAILGVPLIAVILALIVFAICRVLEPEHDEGMGFTAAFAALVIAMMISNVGRIIDTIGAYLTSNASFSISPALLVDSDNAFVTFALSLFNPFTIWFLFALGVGISMLSRAPRAKAIGVLVAVWVAGGALLVGIGQLFAGLTGMG